MSFISIALPIVCDIRDENQVQSAIEQTAQKFNGSDSLVSVGAPCIDRPRGAAYVDRPLEA